MVSTISTFLPSTAEKLGFTAPATFFSPSRCGLTEATGFPSDLATMRPNAMPPASIPATTSGSSIRFCSTASRTISAIALPTRVNRRTLEPIGFQLTYTSYRSEEHTSELQSQSNLVCRLLLEKKKKKKINKYY